MRRDIKADVIDLDPFPLSAALHSTQWCGYLCK